jgi:hypothetical protein
LELLDKTQAELGIVLPELKQEIQALKDEVLEDVKDPPNSVSIQNTTIPTVVASSECPVAIAS